MRADNSRHVIAAARRRAAVTHTRAVAALRRMDKAGLPITFDSLAKEARVSRSWLYNEPDLRAEVERLRARRTPPPPSRPVPDRQRASNAWLLQRGSPQPSAFDDWRRRTGNSARRSPWPSENAGRRTSSAAPATRRERNP